MTLQQAELAAVAVAAAAKAEIESSYILAIKNPRNEDDSRTRILNVCRNLKFAEGAKYSKPQGSKKNDRTGQWEKNYVVGPSIRFAEEAIRLWKNIKVIHTTIYDDPTKRVVKVTVIDLESNISYSKDITIEKIVERKDTKGRTVVGERVNSYGEKISIVLATEDEIQNKESALASKTIRNNSLRVIPDYIITEAMEIVDGVVKARVDADPAAAKRMVLDNFAKLNILPASIEQYLGHPLDVITTAEIVELKQLFTTIHEGNATWSEIMDGKKGEQKGAETAPMGAPEPGFKAGDASTHQGVSKPIGDLLVVDGKAIPRIAGESEWEYEERVDGLKQKGGK